MTKQIYPCLWFDGQAKEAAVFYCSIFKNARITAENPIVVNFEVDGFKFICLNGGPKYKATPATSFVIPCDTQEEIDYYWEKLGEGGRYDQCGWLSDKFGYSWQVVPTVLNQLMADPVKAPRVIDAFLKMTKFDIQTLLDV
jgi:predicted 3-demethylubiquinone-9 3-methyltransferase (glyoxalase superfamily)